MDEDDRTQLKESLGGFLDRRAPVAQLRGAGSDRSYDHLTWVELMQGMGVGGLGIPESRGGVGGGLRGLIVVMEELGRVLYDGPFLSSAVLAAGLVANGSTPGSSDQLLPGIVSGDTVATTASSELCGDFAVEARDLGGTWRLGGHAGVVLDGSHADKVLVVAAGPDDGSTLFVVDGKAKGLAKTTLNGIDGSRDLCRLTFDDVSATAISVVGGAADAAAAVQTWATCALAAEQLGGAEACLAMSVEYAKNRSQFGRTIGSFQAIKHLCADTFVEVELARSAVEFAADEWDSGTGGAAAASLAKVQATRAFIMAARTNIQVHGGIGFTHELDAHLYFKRAFASKPLLGDPSSHLALLEDSLDF